MKLIALFLLIAAVRSDCAVRPPRNVNVDNRRLSLCSSNPLTGWFRDGYCNVNSQDYGVHAVCAEMTQAFLDYTKSRGNDLSTPRRYFPGLKPGDKWCLCAVRWDQARRAGFAPRVVLAATNRAALSVVPRGILAQHAAITR